MDMGKCTSCTLYIKQIQQHTSKQPASLFCLNLHQQTNLYLNNIIYSPHPTPPFPKKKEEKKGHQQSPRFNLTCTSRACSSKVLPK